MYLQSVLLILLAGRQGDVDSLVIDLRSKGAESVTKELFFQLILRHFS